MTSAGDDLGDSRDVTRSRDHRANMAAKRRRKIKLTIVGITLHRVNLLHLLHLLDIITVVNDRHYSTVDSGLCHPGCRYAVHVTAH